jgi:hypothetical protein
MIHCVPVKVKGKPNTAKIRRLDKSNTIGIAKAPQGRRPQFQNRLHDFHHLNPIHAGVVRKNTADLAAGVAG